MTLRDPLETRLLAKLVKGDQPNDCWLFTGFRHPTGYGTIPCDRDRNHGHYMLAHRAAYEVWVGPIPEGFQVCHHCDNPPCCRPDHLFLGTAADNAADMRRKGRAHDISIHAMRGEHHPSAVLTALQVMEIRHRYALGRSNQRALAREYGVSQPAICMVLRGRTWQHLLPQAG